MRKHLTYANVVSSLCLFIVLGGGVAIAATAQKNSVKSSSVKNNTLKGIDVLDNSLTGADIDEASLVIGAISGGNLADGSVSTAKLADNAVTNPKVADNAIGSAEVIADSLAAGDIAPDSVGASELANNSVGSANVIDNNLVDDDLATNSVGFSEIAGNAVRGFQANASGPSTENFGTINTNNCGTVTVTATPIDGSILNDAIVATPPVAFAGDFSISAEASTATTFLLKACNNGSVNADPDGAGGAYQYVSFDG